MTKNTSFDITSFIPAQNELLGKGNTASVWRFGEHNVLRLVHCKADVEEDENCVRFYELLERVTPHIPIPTLIERGIFEPPITLDVPYYTWQIYQHIHGIASSLYLSANKSQCEPFCVSLARALSAFHLAANEISDRISLPDHDAYKKCHQGRFVSTALTQANELHSPSAKFLSATTLLEELTSDLVQTYPDVYAKNRAVIHGDIHYNNLLAHNHAVSGIIDPIPCIAPVETELAGLSSYPDIMISVTSNYAKEAGLSLNAPFLYASSAAFQLAQSLYNNPKRLALVAYYLDKLAKSSPARLTARYCGLSNRMTELCS